MAQINTISNSRSAPAKTRMIIHGKGDWHKSVLNGDFDFFNKLAAKASKENIKTFVVQADTNTSNELLSDDQIHIMLGDIPKYDHRILHAMPTYIWGFWYLDEIGVHSHSSHRLKPFVPEGIHFEEAEYFFNGVSGWMLSENISKFDQPNRKYDLEPAAAVVYCQDIEKFANRIHYLTSEEMIATAALHLGGEKVYVKMHPSQTERQMKSITRLAARLPNVEISDASVHDLTAASRVVITQNSAAGFEALMQKKPVITCAKSNYHHATWVVRSPRQLRDAIQHAPDTMAEFPFEKYFFWFLNIHCLESAKDDFEDRAWNIIKEKMMLPAR